MRKLLLVVGALVGLTGCVETTAPELRTITVRCELRTLPDGTVYDSCR